MIDELEVLWYLSGMLPLTVAADGKKILLKSPKEYAHLRPYKIGVTDTAQRHDMRAFRLYRRVTERARKDGPNWTTLLSTALSFPFLQKKSRPVGASFQDVVKFPQNFDGFIMQKIRDYYLGIAPITTNDRGTKLRIRPLQYLALLMPTIIRKKHDAALHELLAAVKYDSWHNDGSTWGAYLTMAGALDDVIAFHGMRVTHTMISRKWSEDDDYQFLKSVMLGKIAVTYRGRNVHVSSGSDFHLFAGVDKNFRTPERSPPELNALFNRAALRYTRSGDRKRGKSAAQLLAAVLSDPDVFHRSGGISRDAIIRMGLIAYFKAELRGILTGKASVHYHDKDVFIRPQENMHILRPESPYAGAPINKLHSLIRWHRRKTGMGYYDLIDAVGSEPDVVAYHGGMPVTRQVISPRAAVAVSS